MSASTSLILYPIHCGLLPEATRYIVATIRETRWAVPASRIIDLATAYYEEEGWDEDVPMREQPRGKELRGIVEVNGDTCHHFKEARWSEVEDVAVLISGDASNNPGRDKCWWFEEQGGDIDEMTTIPIQEQRRRAYGPLWLSEEQMRAWQAEDRNRHDVLMYFHGNAWEEKPAEVARV